MDEETRARFGTLEGWIEALRMAEGFYPGAEGFRIGPIRLFVQAVEGDYHVHQREEDGTESDLTGAKSLQGIPLSATAPTAAQIWAYDADLDEWVLASSAAPGAHALGGAAHTADTLAHLNTKVSDATLDDSSASRTPSAHSVASHSDTTATGAELETLTDGSTAGGLHVHVEAEITDLDHLTGAEAIAAVEGEATLDLAGDVTIAATKSLAVDTISEKTGAAGVTIDGSLLKDNLIYPDSGNADAAFGVAAGDFYLFGDVSDSDYLIFDTSGDEWIYKIANTARLTITAAGVTVAGNITVGGTVDGVDIAARDHAKYTNNEAIAAVKPQFLVDFGTEISGQEFTP